MLSSVPRQSSCILVSPDFISIYVFIKLGFPQPQPGRGTNENFEAGPGFQPSPPALPTLLRLFPALIIILVWQ